MKKNLFAVLIVVAVTSMTTIVYQLASHSSGPNAMYLMKLHSISFISEGGDKFRKWWSFDVTQHTTVIQTTVVPTTTGFYTTEEPCRETANFVFIKTHKTGSTTLRCLTTRFGYLRNLSFVLGTGSIIGHLNGISPRMTRGSYNILPPIGVRRGDYKNYKNYNISNVHMVFNGAKIDDLMYQGADLKYITILRDPSQRWLSHFQYYKGYKRAGMTRDNISQELLPYLRNIPESNTGAFNKQMRDLGIGGDLMKRISSNRTGRILNETIEQIDQRLSLVLITEYFDESLLVLKRLFCWTFEDILYVKQRQQPNPLVVDNRTIEVLQGLNWADEALYRHFLDVLWRRVREYGPSFNRDLEEFRKLINETSERCLAKSVAEVSVDKYVYVENYSVTNDTFCWALVNSKFHMDIEVVRRQGHTLDRRWTQLDF